ncbi:hypothetical protein HZ326_22056 [Fusarium oxysporum f. sp. albedinis]|nr:hypothetical protein HZ326_22056 [Fusarium oxysporum f. sp. albedinis]
MKSQDDISIKAHPVKNRIEDNWAQITTLLGSDCSSVSLAVPSKIEAQLVSEWQIGLPLSFVTAKILRLYQLHTCDLRCGSSGGH